MNTFRNLIIVIVAAFAFMSCQEANDIISEGNVKLKALSKPVEAIHDFTGDICTGSPTICGPEVVIVATPVSKLYSSLGTNPNPTNLPTVLTDHIYIGHINGAINGNLTISTVYNQKTNKLFLVFLPTIGSSPTPTPVFVYPFTN